MRWIHRCAFCTPYWIFRMTLTLQFDLSILLSATFFLIAKSVRASLFGLTRNGLIATWSRDAWNLWPKLWNGIFTIYAHIDLLHMRMRVIIMGFPQMCNMYIFIGLTTWVKWATIGLINVMMNKSIKSFKINVPIGLRRLVSWRKCLKECLYNEVWIDARGL